MPTRTPPVLKAQFERMPGRQGGIVEGGHYGDIGTLIGVGEVDNVNLLQGRCPYDALLPSKGRPAAPWDAKN